MSIAQTESDVVVVGSGAGGLVAAVTAASHGLSVTLLERSNLIGGTTSFSGGILWAPGNSHFADVEVDDSRDEALEYLDAVVGQSGEGRAMMTEYVEGISDAIDHVEGHSRVRFVTVTSWSDYHADLPGGKLLGRSIEPRPYSLVDELGEWAPRIRQGPHMPTGLLADERAHGLGEALPASSGDGIASWKLDQFDDIVAERAERGIVCGGRALVGGLLKGALDAGVRIELGARARKLAIEDGVVTGVVVGESAEEVVFGAARGVVLAAGGFEWNPELVRSLLGVPRLWPLSPPNNEGDALLMGLEAGAAMSNIGAVWRYPATIDGQRTYEGEPMAIMSVPRMVAGCIAVNRDGKRFANEAVSYVEFGKAHKAYDERARRYPNAAPCWLIFDQTVRDELTILDLVPDKPVPSWVHEASTISDLAVVIGVDPDALVDEVQRFNGHVENGSDPDFGRGTAWFEGRTTAGPKTDLCLARLERAPFYAMPLVDGSLGTAGGLRVDENGQVRAARGGVVPGLYAAGNSAASIFGETYPGGGTTLGLATFFGFRAGRHMAASLSDGQRPAVRAHLETQKV